MVTMAQLTEYQRKQLTEYLQEKAGYIKERNLTLSDVAQLCLEILKFRVDHGNISHRMGQDKLIEHTWPGTEQSKKGRLTSKAVVNQLAEQIEGLRVFAHHLCHSLAELGVTPSPPLTVPTWKELLAQVRQDLAGTDLRDDLEK
jgi:transposase